MTRRELIERVALLGGEYTEHTLQAVIHEEAVTRDGQLVRLHVGVFRLRRAGEQPAARRRVARDWVFEALVRLHRAGHLRVTRREVEAELAAAGLRYSERAVNKGLTDLVRGRDQRSHDDR
jgi:hypothetical protein